MGIFDRNELGVIQSPFAPSSGGGGGGGTPAGSSGAVQFNAAGSFGADSSNLFWDDTNNRLGIGTASPGYIFHSLTAGGYAGYFESAAGGCIVDIKGVKTGPAAVTVQIAAQENTAKIGTSSTDPFFLCSDNTNRLQIGSSGDITVLSTYQLNTNSIVPNSDVTYDVGSATNSFNNGYFNAIVSASGDDSIDLSAGLGLSSTTSILMTALSGTIQMADASLASASNGYVWTLQDNSTGEGAWVAASGAAAGSNGQVQFNNSGSFGAESNLFWDASNNRLGIQNSSPTAPLSVNCPAPGGAGIRLYQPDGNGVYFYIESDANGTGIIGAQGGQIIFGAESNHGVQIKSNNTTRIQLDAGGKITFNRETVMYNSSADPGSPVAGMVFYDTDVNKLKVYNGTTWETITSS